MKKLSVGVLIFVVLSGVALAAQEKVTVRWHRTAPETEAFAVLMPEPPLRVRRVIPFSAELKLAMPVYEVAHRGILYSVLSVDKKAAAALKTQSEFLEGLRLAIHYGSRPANSDLTFEREVSSGNQTGRQFLVRAKGEEGTAQVYETATHYYVLLTLGARASELSASNFFNSFTLDPKRARDASDSVTVVRDFSQSQRAPEPLWPLGGSSSAIGPVGPIDSTVRGTSRAPSANEKPEVPGGAVVLRGGVLNGKVLSKPQPTYPRIAIAARAQGTVSVQVIVDEEGYVISARAVEGHPLLQQAAVQAARQVRFTPTLLEGVPVKVSGVITYNFVLAPDPDEPPTRKY